MEKDRSNLMFDAAGEEWEYHMIIAGYGSYMILKGFMAVDLDVSLIEQLYAHATVLLFLFHSLEAILGLFSVSGKPRSCLL